MRTLESLLEEAHIKLSSLVSDPLGVSARRMLQAGHLAWPVSVVDGTNGPAHDEPREQVEHRRTKYTFPLPPMTNSIVSPTQR